jgi:cytochrome P450
MTAPPCPRSPRPGRQGVALGASAGLPARHPVGATGAAVSGLDGRVPHAVLRSYLCNDPALVRRVLDERPADFPKSGRVTEGLRPLLGRSVFVTNGEEWLHQRRIIDPAFEGGRLKEAFPAIWAAAEAAVARMGPGEVEVELAASHAAADVIFRTLFSIPIEDRGGAGGVP